MNTNQPMVGLFIWWTTTIMVTHLKQGLFFNQLKLSFTRTFGFSSFFRQIMECATFLSILSLNQRRKVKLEWFKSPFVVLFALLDIQCRSMVAPKWSRHYTGWSFGGRYNIRASHWFTQDLCQRNYLLFIPGTLKFQMLSHTSVHRFLW